MGLTAETVQVFCAGAWAANLQKRIAEVAVNHVTHQGYEEALREEEADRILVVAPVSDGGWISIYDSDFGGSEKLAKEISKSVLSPAVSLTVFDSDDVLIRLFEGGKVQDRHEFSGGKLRKRANADKWTSVTDPDQRARIGEILKAQSLFAEEQLIRLAEVLGMSAEQCVTPVAELPSTEDGFQRFYFRHPRREKSADSPAGLPVLAAGPSSHPWRAAMGEQLPHIGLYAINQGAAMQGVHIKLEGSALDEGLVALSELKVFNTGRKDIRTFPLEPGQREVEWKDFVLAEAPGAPRGLRGLAGMLLSGRTSVHNRMDHYISVSLKGTLCNQGQGELQVVITPLANPEGAARLSYPILVQPPAKGPLKADLSLPGASQRSRYLYTPRVLQILFSFVPADDRVTAFASHVVERWIAFLERTRPEGWFCTKAQAPLAMPQFLETTRNDLSKQKKWTKWHKEMGQHESLTAHIGTDRMEGDVAFHGCAGLGFHRGQAHTVMSMLTASPHLSLWLDTGIFTDEETEEAERMLAGFAQEAATAGLLIQASLSRNLTGSGGSAESTAYEFASGVQGQCTMTVWWCERYLRAVGTQMWLGPQLTARIASREALSHGAEVASAGNCLHLIPRDPAQTETLEKALAEILAGSVEWQTGMRVRYNQQMP
ncbi:MAG: hypothetical protein U0R19_08145 [Bryobacteraceae bacterium]